MRHLGKGLARLKCDYCPLPYNISPRPYISTSIFHSTRQARQYVEIAEDYEPQGGTRSPEPDEVRDHPISKSAWYFETGYALFAKRRSKPFPPPFLSRPSTSFSDPLSTHHRSQDRRLKPQFYQGEMIRGITNGDDAVLVGENMIAANDGVGAWAQKEKGHAALWSRLIIHFWALEAERDVYGASSSTEPDPKRYLQTAYEQTKEATNTWLGTTTASSALIHSSNGNDAKPIVYVTQLGDSQILIIRPRIHEIIFRTKEQWHWFDCPRQLGTNSPDTPAVNAVVNKVEVEEDDVVLAMSDGVVDNLWEHEIVDKVVASLKEAEGKFSGEADFHSKGMKHVATEVVKAAMKIAKDPYAESPYMERGIEEGLSMEGGKLDDISLVAAICRPRQYLGQTEAKSSAVAHSEHDTVENAV